MSSEQFSEKPLPAEQKHCYYCGALTPARNRRCWLCEEKFAIKEAKPGPVRQSTATPADARRVGYAWAVMGLLGVLVCGGLAFEMPGVLVAPLILMVPVMIWIVASNRKSESEIGATQKALMNCAALGVASLVVLGIVAAFVVMCTVNQLGVHH